VAREARSVWFKPRDPASFHSEANLLTYVRLVACLVFFVLAVTEQRELYNFIGILIHWIGDVVDGKVARVFKQETIFGAEIDIIADRVEAIFFYVNFLFFHPILYLPVVIYLVDFAFIDFYLSNQSFKFGIISPNYFYKVDDVVFRLNYSWTAKVMNSAVVAGMLIFLPKVHVGLTIVATSVLAAGLIGVKIYSIYRLYRRPGHPPLVGGPAGNEGSPA